MFDIVSASQFKCGGRAQAPMSVRAKARGDLVRLLSGTAPPFGVHAANGSALSKEGPGEVSAY
jgi:hypothetical protein